MVLAWAYAGVGVALHLTMGVLFALGFSVLPWWFVALLLAVWAALWLPVVRLLRTRPGAVAFLVLFADLTTWFAFGAIADAVGWM
jgi:hypothetical protein